MPLRSTAPAQEALSFAFPYDQRLKTGAKIPQKTTLIAGYFLRLLIGIKIALHALFTQLSAQ